MDIKKVLIANRGEIAIRIFRACNEIGLSTVGIFTYEDRYSQHRYKADEAYQIGMNDQPLKPYLDIDAIVALALSKKVDAIHPGYGFLAENVEFAQKCKKNGIVFIGPDAEIMEALGDKLKAKKIAEQCGVPIIASSKKKLTNVKVAKEEAKRVGYPVMLKAVSGGGGRGMRVIGSADDLDAVFAEARSEALNAFGDDTVFIEKYIEEPKHIEIQLMGDQHGNLVHLFERDCSVQRRHQKIVEFAPSLGVDQEVLRKLYDYAITIGKAVQYNNVGTVEFLVGQDKEIYFIEVNPRIQVEHTVTEMVTGIDIVKAQVFIAGGYKLSDEQIKIPGQEALRLNGYAIQCRITTEDPENDFMPDYGTIITYRSAAGFGIRLDVGSLYQGVRVSPFFDPMLVKLSGHSRSLDGATRKMLRALKEFRIRGVKTNIKFLENIMLHRTFKMGRATVNFIQHGRELFKFEQSQDRATKIVNYLGDVTINGNPDVKHFDPKKKFYEAIVPEFDPYGAFPKGTKDRLTKLGPEEFSKWLKKQKGIHYTDTTFRDAHQSLLATRMRTYDMLKVAESFARNHPEVFSMEVWGGATFDVCLRFLSENPWRRLAEIREAVPNILLQMLLRGSNAVGYTAYPDNLIEAFIEQAWTTGIDVFRIFDSLNWVKAMEPSIGFVRSRTGALAEASICYTGDILDKKRSKYTLKYYVQLAKDLENAGAHILAIKDMAGLLKPYAATELVAALQDATDLPIHLHTHDTSSLQTATYLKAIEAGVDVVDVALGGLSGSTSQPNFNSIVEMMRFNKREQKMDIDKLNEFSNYWETVREYYYPFESGLKGSTAEVFQHEIPGGQYSNLKPQAEALGLGERFHEITRTYKEVNELFGDVIKVTPSSKVVGDMALFMVSNDLTAEDILESGDTLDLPASVISFFKGDLGQPHGGFPKKLQKIILKGEKPYTQRPNEHMEPIELDTEYIIFVERYQKGFARKLRFSDFLSYKLYPKVFVEALERFKKFGDVSRIPTKNFFYGMEPMEETMVNIGSGKTIIVQLLSIGQVNDEGLRTVFFKVNGQTRNVQIEDRSVEVSKIQNRKKDPEDSLQVGSPLQGALSNVLVKKGQEVKKSEALFVIEAMKMETTVTSPADGKVKELVLKNGSLVDADDLIVVLAN